MRRIVSAEFEIHKLIDDNAGKDDEIVFADGSVQRGDRPGWGLPARIKGKVVAQQSVVYPSTSLGVIKK